MSQLNSRESLTWALLGLPRKRKVSVGNRIMSSRESFYEHRGRIKVVCNKFPQGFQCLTLQTHRVMRRQQTSMNTPNRSERGVAKFKVRRRVWGVESTPTSQYDFFSSRFPLLRDKNVEIFRSSRTGSNIKVKRAHFEDLCKIKCKLSFRWEIFACLLCINWIWFRFRTNRRLHREHETRRRKWDFPFSEA